LLLFAIFSSSVNADDESNATDCAKISFLPHWTVGVGLFLDLGQETPSDCSELGPAFRPQDKSVIPAPWTLATLTAAEAESVFGPPVVSYEDGSGDRELIFNVKYRIAILFDRLTNKPKRLVFHVLDSDIFQVLPGLGFKDLPEPLTDFGTLGLFYRNVGPYAEIEVSSPSVKADGLYFYPVIMELDPVNSPRLKMGEVESGRKLAPLSLYDLADEPPMTREDVDAYAALVPGLVVAERDSPGTLAMYSAAGLERRRFAFLRIKIFLALAAARGEKFNLARLRAEFMLPSPEEQKLINDNILVLEDVEKKYFTGPLRPAGSELESKQDSETKPGS
jgi:hypothetical protein